MNPFLNIKLKAKEEKIRSGSVKQSTPSMTVTILRTRPVRKRKTLFDHNQILRGSVVKGMYNIRKDNMSEAVLSVCKEETTVQPKKSSASMVQRSPYPLWSESKTFLRVPRFFGILKFGPPEKCLLTDGDPMVAMASTVTPRPYQVEPIDALCSIFRPGGGAGAGAFLEADCGTGKTYLGIEVAARHGRKTAILVHKGDLAEQFKERVSQYYPSAKVGIVQRDRVEIDGCDFVIFMAQSIVSGRYDEDADRIFGRFGCVIVDECHHWVAETLSKTLCRFSARCLLGLSATPDRKDGLGFALQYFFGSTAVQIKRRDQRVNVRIEKITSGRAFEVIGRTGRPILATTVTMMTNDEERNARIVEIVLRERKNGHVVIVMGDRRKHLVNLQLLLQGKTDEEVGLYVGETTKRGIARRNAGKQSPILLCTTRMAEEGLDIPTLSCLVMVTPKSNITQCVGRIQRTDPRKTIVPLVVDLYDTYCGGAVHGMARARQRFYEANGFTNI